MSQPRLLLDLSSLSDKVSKAIFEQGLAAYRQQKVMDCTLTAAGTQAFDILGRVQGTGQQNHRVSVVIEASDAGVVSYFQGECNCALRSNCRHCVALAIKASFSSMRQAAQTNKQAQNPPESAALWVQGESADFVLLETETYTPISAPIPAATNAPVNAQTNASIKIPVKVLTRSAPSLGLPKVALKPGKGLFDDDEISLSTTPKKPAERPKKPTPKAANLSPLKAQVPEAALPLAISAQRPNAPANASAEVLRGRQAKAQLHITRVEDADSERLGLLRATLRFDYEGLSFYALEDHNPVLVDALDIHLTVGINVESSPDKKADKTKKPPKHQVLLQRDLAAEQNAHHSLHTLGLSGDSLGRFYLPFISTAQQQLWLEWMDNDFAIMRAAGFEVTTDSSLEGWIAHAQDLKAHMHSLASPPVNPLNSKTPSASPKPIAGGDTQADWFKLSLGMSVGGERRNILPLLPELLAQLGAAAQSVTPATIQSTDTSANPPSFSTLQLPTYLYIKQDDGYLRLPCEPLRPWLQALLELMTERGLRKKNELKIELSGTSLRLSRLEAMRLEAELQQHPKAGGHWQGEDSLQEMLGQLASRQNLPAVTLPSGLKAQLRPYQLDGVQWLQFLHTHGLSGILADDMGLGKTLQTLTHILIEKEAGRLALPVLVIAPVSLMGNWRKEAAHFTPSLRTLVVQGNSRHETATEMGSFDLVIAPYSLLQRDRERWQAQSWHMVVLDEAQNIKNASSHAAQIAGALDAKHRLCLSGTPMENNLGELWSLFNFLMPGFLGSQARFKSLYRTPIEKHGDQQRAERLRHRLKPFMLRRLKSEVATDLPEKQVCISVVTLAEPQADLYETIRLGTEKTVHEALANKGLAGAQIQILDALLKLRQVCCDPRLVALPAAKKIKSSAKLELLMELLPDLLLAGRRVLLFSQFTSMLELIEEELEKRQIKWVKLTGQSQNREQLIERFTSGEVPLFLISLKAGGVGLNLTEADTVIHYDPWWNPAAQAQATDRAHRIGQTKPVMVYKLVAQDTIEERILALQERKAALADSMYGEMTQGTQPIMTQSDLASLLEPMGYSLNPD